MVFFKIAVEVMVIIIASPQDKPTWGMLSSGFSGESPLFMAYFA